MWNPKKGTLYTPKNGLLYSLTPVPNKFNRTIKTNAPVGTSTLQCQTSQSFYSHDQWCSQRCHTHK